MNKDDKRLKLALAALKDFRSPEPITFEQFLEQLRMFDKETYNQYMKALAEVEKAVEKKNEKK